MLKSQSTTLGHSSQQEGGKNVQTGRHQTVLSTSWTKGFTTTLDEFKHGFPSKGVSTLSNKWWGSSTVAADDGAGSLTMEEERLENTEETNVGPQGTGSLMAVRKKIVEEGREALRLGVNRRYGANKLSKRERTLLLRIFKSSTPQEWINGAS